MPDQHAGDSGWILSRLAQGVVKGYSLPDWQEQLLTHALRDCSAALQRPQSGVGCEVSLCWAAVAQLQMGRRCFRLVAVPQEVPQVVRVAMWQ